MDRHDPASTKSADNEASSSAGVTHKTNIVQIERNSIQNQKLQIPNAGAVQMPITGNGAVVNLSSTTTIIQEIEIKKHFPVKYNIVNLEQSFHGRDKELHQLETNVFKNSKTKIVISGLPGIGKTQLACKFMFEHEMEYNGNILWISAETKDSLKQSFTNIATILKMNEVFLINDTKNLVKKVYSYFEENSCLFVFDNAQNMNDIKTFLPTQNLHSNVKYTIIITSTESIWGREIPVIKLDKLSQEAAINVAKKIIGDSNCNSEVVWIRLVELVERIPLGLQIISNLICTNILYATEITKTFSIEDFLKTFGTEMLLDESFPLHSENSYTKSIYLSIKLAIEKIEEYSESGHNNHSVYREALDVLHTVAYLCPDSINTECLLLFSHLNKSKQIFEKALAILSGFCLIRVHFGTISIHRLVQQTICLYQERKKIQEKYITSTLNTLFGPLTAWKVDRVHRRFILKHKSCTQWCIDLYSTTKSPLLLYTLVEDGNVHILSKLFDKMSKDQKEHLFKDSSILLQKATDRQDETIIKFLLDHGATIQHNDLTLQYSLKTRNWIAAIFLIQNKCNVNIPDALGNSPLFILIGSACKDISTKAILELLLSHGADIFAKNYEKQTLLHICATHQQIDFLKYLCEKTEIPKYINEVDIRGFTPLHTLLMEHIEGKHTADTAIEIFEYLIKMGAKSLLKTNKGETILHIAVTTSSLQLIKYIIQQIPLIINEVDNKGRTALQKCLSNKDYFYRNDIIHFLVAKGTDLTIVDNEGETLLHAAAKQFRGLTFEYILNNAQNINVNAQDKNGYTFLHNCLNETVHQSNRKTDSEYKSLADFIRSLKKYAFDFSLKTNKNQTLLHFAATKANLKLLQAILDVTNNSYDINVQDTMGCTALHWLFHSNYKRHTLSELEPCLKFLIQNGADVNLANRNEQTILHLCAAEADFQLIEIILNVQQTSLFNKTNEVEIKFNINHQDINGNTALHKICEYNFAHNTSMKCINILLDHGADIHIKNNNNETALNIAATRNSYISIKAIIEHKNVTLDISKDTNFFDIILFKFIECVVYDSEFSADVKQIGYFLKMDANINTTNQENQTLLHIAMRNVNFELIKFICNHHQYTQDINAQDNKGNTALHCLLKNKTRSNRHLLDWKNHLKNVLNIIEYLVNSKGADINAKNNSQQIVLHFAAASNILNIVKCVMEICIKSTTFNINDQDEFGNTVLHYLFNNDWLPDCKDVFDREFFAVLNYLLSNNANPTIVNKENKRPSQIARENNLSNLAGFLDEYVETNHTTVQ